MEEISDDFWKLPQLNLSQPDSAQPTPNIQITPDITVSDKKFSISAAYPKKLSKRYNSTVIVSIYFRELKHKLKQFARKQGKDLTDEVETVLVSNKVVCVKLSSQDIEFADGKVIKKLSRQMNNIEFLAKPKDNCFVGKHRVKVSILDDEERFEINSLSFEVEVVDLIANFISRPFLSQVVSVAAGLGGLAIFLPGLFQKIDATLGLTSGATIAVIAGLANFKFLEAYRPQQKASVKE